MQVVISRKHNMANEDQKLDLRSLTIATSVPSSNISIKTFFDPVQVEKFIASQIERGFVCHKFDYMETFVAKTQIQIHDSLKVS